MKLREIAKELVRSETGAYPIEVDMYIQHFLRETSTRYSFNFIGQDGDVYHFQYHCNPYFGDLRHIITSAYIEARIDLKKKEAIFEMGYTLTGTVLDSAIIGKVKKKGNTCEYIPFNNDDFKTSDSKIK